MGVRVMYNRLSHTPDPDATLADAGLTSIILFG
jgi:hypothetical protein